MYFNEVDSLTDSASTSKKAPRIYLEQLKASIECDRRINSLISFYNELEKKAVSLQTRITALKLES